MAQPSTAWREQVSDDEAVRFARYATEFAELQPRKVVYRSSQQGRGALLALLLALSASAHGCTREEPPAPEPPPPGPQAGTVLVETQPAGLELVADGTVRCRTPCSFRIDPGLHQLSIHKTGYLPWQERVEVRPRAEVKVSAALVSSH